VFCSDESATFDPTGRVRRDNVRKNISGLSEVDLMISLLKEKQRLLSEDCIIENGELQCRYDQRRVDALTGDLVLLCGIVSERVGIWPS
jgi:hypothetical protein